MRISRRGFLASVGAMPIVGGQSWPRPTVVAGRVGCVLAESRAGFDEALSHLEERRLVIFPGAVGWEDSLPGRVRAGATVLFESAAGFGDATEFAAQRAGLRSAFGLMIEPPAEPWTDRARPAFIDLHWPAVARVRDFSTVVRVRGGETVGRLGPFRVAARRRLGAVSFLFLGSPIGPALWSGDPQAHAWLEALVAGAPPRAPLRAP